MAQRDLGRIARNRATFRRVNEAITVPEHEGGAHELPEALDPRAQDVGR